MNNASETFLRTAREALSFLETQHGFQVAETIAPEGVLSAASFYKITYRRTLADDQEQFVSLSTAPVRLEQDLEIGRGWPPAYRNTMSLLELLDLESPRTRPTFTAGIYEAFGDDQKMLEHYTVLSSMLEAYGHRFFSHDASLWRALWQLRAQQQEEQERQETTRRAEAAFKAKDWHRAIELLEGLGSQRTKLQNARLAFARQRAREEA